MRAKYAQVTFGLGCDYRGNLMKAYESTYDGANMGYQALLFCPDEKTARSVTQVLSDLDFEVAACAEPFSAVKKMMGTHFDAVVVDCENEQDATLIFKSARNAPNSQSALAVGVVEGQIGVAKAFRIGANLVLTKPINVEQAKSTLRVARGLLRKGEAAKPASGAAAQTTPEASKAEPTRSEAALPAIPVPPAIPARKAAAATLSAAAGAAPEVKEPVPAEAPTKPGFSKAHPTGAGGGAAAAAAPARETKAKVAAEREPKEQVDTALAIKKPGSSAPVKAPALSSPDFALGQTQPASPGSKKLLTGIAVTVLLAAGGYSAWTRLDFTQRLGIMHKLGSFKLPAAVSSLIGAKPVTTAAPPAPVVSTPAIAPQQAASTPNSGEVATTANGETAAPPESAPDSADETAETAIGAPAHTANTHPSSSPHATVQGAIVMRDNSARKMKSIRAEAAPAIAAIPASNGEPLPTLLASAGGAPVPRLQTLSVSQGVSRGLLLKQTQPAYPADALRLGIEGPVELMATVSKAGDISAVKILSGDSRLAHAAVEAVKRWKYKPYLLDGEPVEIQTQVTVNFKLPR